jgi:hypothetical protein
MLPLLLAATALAGGFYHPNDIAGESQLFVDASERSMEPMQSLNRRLGNLSVALVAYEQSLDLLGDAAPTEERERLSALRTQYNREFAQLQAFADAVIEDFDTEFTTAMERALAPHGTAEICERLVPAGRTLPGMPARLEKNPNCKGEDLNGVVAGAMDSDLVLKTAVAEITGAVWPTIDLDQTPQAPIGPSDAWIDVHKLINALAREPLREIDRNDERDRAEFELSIAEGASKEELAQYVDAAEQLGLRTARARAGLAEPILTAAAAVLQKWSTKGKPAVGWCANPLTLGGCTGAEADADLVQELVNDKKVLKSRP